MRSKASCKWSLSVVLAFALAMATSVAARTYTMTATEMAPGATGDIDVNAQKDGANTALTVKVDHLARPTQLTPPATDYVVWIQPENKEPQNAGVLNVGSNEKGDLKATTTASKFTVLVTAEKDAQAQTPSNRVVLRTEVTE